jgi:hypothetical protein
VLLECGGFGGHRSELEGVLHGCGLSEIVWSILSDSNIVKYRRTWQASAL